MERLFAESVERASRLHAINGEQKKILEQVDQACQDLYLPEIEHYIAHKYNEETPRVLSNYGLMGLAISPDYGGLGADPLTWAP